MRVRGLTNAVRATRTQWAPGPLPGGILVATAACRTGRVWVRQRAGLLLSGRGCPPLLKAGLGDGTGRRFGNGARMRTDAHGGGAGYPRGTDTLVRGRPWGRGFEPKGAGRRKAAQARRVAADFWRAEAPWVSRWGVLGGGGSGRGAVCTCVSASVCPASWAPARLFSVWLWDLAHGFCGCLLRTLLSSRKAV